jgi:uncharacterized membrane protein
MQISVKSRGGNITLSVNSSDTIIDVKKKIFEKERIPVHQQILMFNDKHLDNNMTLAYYNIEEMSTINRYTNTLHLRGRMMAD